jgi:hypothetical protein
MKKILIASLLGLSMLSNSSLAEMHDPSRTSGGSSAIIVISPLLSGIGVTYMLRDLSTSNKPIKVKEVKEQNNGKSYIQGEVNGQPIEFETLTKAVAKAKIKPDDNIHVKDAKLGYVMESNNIVLGVVPNAQNSNSFKQEKLN